MHLSLLMTTRTHTGIPYFTYPPSPNTPHNQQHPLFHSRKILNWKDQLIFPDDVVVSDEAKDLIRKFCCESENRLCDVDEIKKHPYFKVSALLSTPLPTTTLTHIFFFLFEGT